MLKVIIKKGWALVSAMLVVSMVFPLYAADCLAPSPTVLAGKSLLAPTASRDLTPSELVMVRKMLQSLEGNWTGHGLEILCPSATGAKSKEERKYEIEGKVSTDDDGNLLLQMELNDTQDQTSQQELFRLYLKGMRLRYSNENYGDVELITLAPNQITFSRRFTLAGYNTGIYKYKENVISLITDARGFTLNRDIYKGGKLTAKRSLRFEGKQ